MRLHLQPHTDWAIVDGVKVWFGTRSLVQDHGDYTLWLELYGRTEPCATEPEARDAARRLPRPSRATVLAALRDPGRDFGGRMT